MKILAVLLCVCLVPSSGLRAQDPPFYRKQATWQETMRLSREAFTAWLAPTAALERSMLGPWYVIGPFVSKTRSPFYDIFPPERKVDLNARYGELKWMGRPDWKENRVIDFPPVPWSDNYLYRTITARNDTVLTLYLGSDDGIQIWVNGVRRLADSSYRPCAPNQDTARIALKKGKNALLMKISNGVGNTAFYFSLSGFNRDELWTFVERDFAGMDQLREMNWERTDSIWAADWKPGDVRELGRRYARAYRDAAEEAGADNPEPPPAVRTPADLDHVRALYEAMRNRELTDLVALTPRESPEPRLTGPRLFGVRPGHPFLFSITATGDRPLTFTAHGLPAGLTLDSTTGRIDGTVGTRGDYRVVLKAANRKGTALRDFRIVVGDRVALTPPLGWNSWNCFADAVSDEKVRQAADAMVKSGLVDHGWTYVNIDDCWMVRPGSKDPLTSGVPRDTRGRVNTNAKFPDMHALASYLHARGLKLGIYSSPGPLTCAGYTGSYQHELDDARQYAEWGVDYLKYDWCSYGSINRDSTLAGYERPYRVMRAALDSVDRDIVYSLCQYGMKNVWEWGDQVGGNCWRTTGDIEDTWESMSKIGFNQDRLAPYAGPGHWNDPDMLVVGWVGWGQTLKPTRLSPNEQLTHITLWSLLAAPMLIGCDMTRLDDFTYSLLSNDEVLEVNQDPLGRQAHRAVREGDTEVWVKEMEDGARAVGLFNRGTRKAEVT
ncbi:MAG TPA: putative Ig domain-containing protein, partial [Bacteroidota bacterium]